MITQLKTETLLTALREGVLYVTLNRPERRNAMSARMIEELLQVFAASSGHTEVRAIVLRGAGATFCAGADVKEMPAASVRQNGSPAEIKAAIARANRRVGDLLIAMQRTTQPVIAAIEGSTMGGGIGLVCVSDVSLAVEDAHFGLPETGLGLLPAQIAPFVVRRVGLTQARRLMLTGARFDGAEAARIGLVHEVCADALALEAALSRVLGEILRCAPRANAATKRLLLESLEGELSSVLDDAAELFAEAATSDEAREGTQAFVEKRLPNWAG
jgi:isohexenylglutaconyl-CoA hydratase